MAKNSDGRTPVIVGVGAVSQKYTRPGEGREALALMIAAAEEAERDAGVGGLLAAVQRVTVPTGSWSYSNPARLVADAIGAPGSVTALEKLGIPQQALLNRSFRDIQAGEIDMILVCAGEAKWRSTLAERAGIPDVVTEQTEDEPDEFLFSPADIIFAPERAAGAVSAVHQFAIADNALRYAEGKSLAEQRAEIDSLWSRFNAVAATNEHAAFPERRDATFLGTPTQRNRPLAYPYYKWHASQWNVDQACALIVTSLETATALGIAADRLVFPLLALESTWVSALSSRRSMHRWPAMEILGEAAEKHIGSSLSGVDIVELYSCFPAAVRVQQRELGLPLDGTPTVTGGMPFGGGPLNHFVLQATTTVIERMRKRDRSTALVGSVSGMLAKPEIALYGREPGERPLYLDDFADLAERATPIVELVDHYCGTATIASYTVTYEALNPTVTIVVADTADGRRCVSSRVDPDFAELAVTEEVIGRRINVNGPDEFTVG